MQIGELVAGRFEIERMAGRGGMGAVYRAIDRSTGAPVAVKLLRVGAERLGDRFDRESRLLAELSHPAIVRYLDHGVSDGGERYLVMEWLDGEDLATRLARAPLSTKESVACAIRVAEALSLAHARGIIHRDIKPNNLFLPDGAIERVKVIDFGIARRGGRGLTMALTRTGAIIGTPGYMAPEQARGDPRVDARADVFSLGCVLFECLSGAPPFRGDNFVAVLARILLEEAPRLQQTLPGIDGALDALVGRMLAKAPNERPSDGAAVATQLGVILGALGDEASHQVDRRPDGDRLTTGEKRLIALLLVGAAHGADGATDETMTADHDETAATDEITFAPLKEIASRFGARMEPLLDGTTLIVLIGVGHATDLAVEGARCARALSEAASQRRVVMAMGFGVMARWPAGEVIDRAFALLQRPRRSDGGGRRAIEIDDLTAGLLAGRFAVHGGKAQFALGEERGQGENSRELLGQPIPCVGREKELALLSALFDESVEERAPRVALVTGNAGLGKSRLRHELLARLRARDQPIEIWFAAGEPLHKGSPFGLLLQILGGAAGLRDGEPIALRRDKLRSRLEHAMAGDSLAHACEFLGELLGVPPEDPGMQLRAARADAEVMGHHLQRAWEAWLAAERAAAPEAQKPIVIVIEDLQWGDLPSVKQIDAALRIGHLPLFVVAFARPEVHEAFGALWIDRGLQELRLGPLGRRAAEAIIRRALGDAADATTVARIIERAAGNALFLEELIRAVAEGRDGALPETVLVMMQERIEALEVDARRVLRAASVFGQTFWRGGLLALSGGDDAQLGDWINLLIEREVIGPRSDGRFPGEQELAFRHELVREAVYATLTDDDRCRGHRLAGEWLEARGERSALALGEHFERGGESKRALAWFQKAAEQAHDARDYALALTLSERCVTLGATGELLGALRELQCIVYFTIGEFAAAERTCLESLSLLPRGSEFWYAAARTLLGLAGVGRFSRLLEVIISLRADGDLPHPVAAHLSAWTLAANALFVMGQGEIAMEFVRRVEAHSARAIAHSPIAESWLFESRRYEAIYQLRDPQRNLEATSASVAILLRAGDLRTVAYSQIGQADALLGVGAWEEAEAIARQIADQAGKATFLLAYAQQTLAAALALAGRGDEAMTCGKLAHQLFARLGIPTFLGIGHTLSARLLLAKGDLAVAEAEARAGDELLAFCPPLRPLALGTLSRILLATGRISEALATAREAHGLLFAATSDGESATRLALAEALYANGDLAESEAALATARRRLLERASRLLEPRHRHGFLNTLPDHRRTLLLARTRIDSPTPL